ncbi:MAG: hypothetical protein NTX03_02820, partial [Bacteroidetes bacterium]|nr:hypothetical protein [Bacteroidota bacterium]
TLFTQVTIDDIPKVFAGNDTFQCLDAALPFDLSTLNATPSGGTWIGTGITGNYFYQNDPTVGIGRKMLIYRFTDNSKPSKCSNEDTVFIDVLRPLQPKGGNYGPYCIDAGIQELNGTPAKSPVWTILGGGSGLTTSGDTTWFDPASAGVGTHKLVFEASYSGRCPKTDTIEIVVNGIPNVSLATKDGKSRYCISQKSVDLDGQPNGGSYSGLSTGKRYIFGKTFDFTQSGPGTFPVTYRYQDQTTGCFKQTTINIQIDDTPNVTIRGGVKPLCKGTSYTLSADTINASAVQWTTNDPTAVFGSPNSLTTTFVPGTSQQTAGAFRVTVTAIKYNNSTCPDAVVNADYKIRPRRI